MKRIFIATLLASCFIAAKAKSNDYRNRGYKGNVELGLYNNFYYGEIGVGVFTTHGMQFNELFFVGGGIGYENYMIPIYADFKSYIVKKEMHVNPWVEMKMGLDALNLDLYLSPSIGISLPIAQKYALSIAFSYGVDVFYGVDNLGIRVGFQF